MHAEYISNIHICMWKYIIYMPEGMQHYIDDIYIEFGQDIYGTWLLAEDIHAYYIEQRMRLIYFYIGRRIRLR